MVAMAIIAIALVAVLGSQSQSVSLASEAKFGTVAAFLAQSKMAEMEFLDPDDLTPDAGDFGEDFPDYRWDMQVSDVTLVESENISDYLTTNGAENSSAEQSVKIMRCLGDQVPIRITNIPYIRKKHHELDPAVFKRESIGSLANCTACHITAEKGIYDDDAVKIPN